MFVLRLNFAAIPVSSIDHRHVTVLKYDCLKFHQFVYQFFIKVFKISDFLKLLTALKMTNKAYSIDVLARENYVTIYFKQKFSTITRNYWKMSLVTGHFVKSPDYRYFPAISRVLAEIYFIDIFFSGPLMHYSVPVSYFQFQLIIITFFSTLILYASVPRNPMLYSMIRILFHKYNPERSITKIRYSYQYTQKYYKHFSYNYIRSKSKTKLQQCILKVEL